MAVTSLRYVIYRRPCRAFKRDVTSYAMFKGYQDDLAVIDTAAEVAKRRIRE